MTHAKISSVPKLDGMYNYYDWLRGFRNFCIAHDEDYWPIYQGTLQPAIQSEIVLSVEESRIRAAQSLSKPPEELSNDEHNEWIKENITVPNKQLTIWELKNAQVVLFLKLSITEGMKSTIWNETIAYKISARFHSAYGCMNKVWLFLKMRALMNVQFKPGVSVTTFTNKFSHAVADLANCRGRKLDPDLVYTIFTMAVLAHGDTADWAERQDPDLNSESCLQEAMDSLILHEQAKH